MPPNAPQNFGAWSHQKEDGLPLVLIGPSSDAEDRKTLDRLEVPAVVRADLELVTETGRRNQEIEVTDRPPLLAKSPALAPEDPAHLVIDRKHRQTNKELLQGGLAADRVTR